MAVLPSHLVEMCCSGDGGKCIYSNASWATFALVTRFHFMLHLLSNIAHFPPLYSSDNWNTSFYFADGIQTVWHVLYQMDSLLIGGIFIDVENTQHLLFIYCSTAQLVLHILCLLVSSCERLCYKGVYIFLCIWWQMHICVCVCYTAASVFKWMQCTQPCHHCPSVLPTRFPILV